jgi:quercetin dioxygenase-like cupin family protein
VLPSQSHPEQYHKVKEETFHVLYGTVKLTLNGTERLCSPGEIITVERGVKHIFSTTTGAIIEEISSTHLKDDSYYTDPAVTQNKNRKTMITHWVG